MDDTVGIHTSDVLDGVYCSERSCAPFKPSLLLEKVDQKRG